MAGAPSLQTVTPIPIPGVGEACLLPYHLFPGAPGVFVVAHGFWPDPAALVPALPAPWTTSFLMPNFPLTFTLQGLVEDTPGTFRVTNGVILNVP
jgi:hypothetical protein